MVDDTYKIEVTHKGRIYEVKHGSPFDRGSADNYYGRMRNPHKGGVGGGSGPRIESLTADEIADYDAGYSWNEQFGEKKR